MVSEIYLQLNQTETGIIPAILAKTVKMMSKQWGEKPNFAVRHNNITRGEGLRIEIPLNFHRLIHLKQVLLSLKHSDV